MSMVGEGNVEVEDQTGNFILLSNDNIDEMKNYNFYADIFQRRIKSNKSTIKNSLKDRLKVDMQNRLRNSTMDKADKSALMYYPETEM